MKYIKDLKKTNEKRLISKKDLLKIAINDLDLNIDELKKMKVNDLRQLCKITHIIDGKPKNYYGHCFSCLKPLRPDYTSYENYCADC